MLIPSDGAKVVVPCQKYPNIFPIIAQLYCGALEQGTTAAPTSEGCNCVKRWENSSQTHTLNYRPHLLDIVVLLSEVAEHVTIVTIDVPTEDLDVALRTELVDPHHQVSGAACQTHLREKKQSECSAGQRQPAGQRVVW